MPPLLPLAVHWQGGHSGNAPQKTTPTAAKKHQKGRKSSGK
jgi:hypothetical protein